MNQRKFAKSILLLLVVVCPLLATVGCQTYGSKLVMVKLQTQPPEKRAWAYLVPIEKWDEITGGKDLDQPYIPKNQETFRQQLLHWRVNQSRTPVITEALPHRTIFVAEYLGQYRWIVISPGMQKSFGIEFE